MQYIYYTVGLPASGKSTKAKEMVDASKGHLKRVNKDDLRSMIDNYDFSKKFHKNNEAFVLTMRDNLIMQALMNGDSAICDDTNFGDKHALRFHQLAAEYTAKTGKPCEVELIDFRDVPVEVCIDRDNYRGDKRVGKDVILRMYNQHIHDPSKPPLPVDAKAWGRPSLPVYVPPVADLPKAVLCDLDGTLALLNGRNPYDATDCDKDGINHPVLLTLQALQESRMIKKVLFMSGREDKYREPTMLFLAYCGFLPGAMERGQWSLHMRTTDDKRKDAVIKRELFDAHVHGKYNPVFVLDDRNQVVDFWRKELGLPCFQVNYGDF